jgi:energy-coupling factor transporter ATP-binding protein EcfA2
VTAVKAGAADAPAENDGSDRGAGGIAATGLRVRYPGRSAPALAGVDLVAEPGERLGVAGRTGAGKSTLALAVAGFLPRVVRATVEGSLTVDGVDPVRAAASDLLGRVGIVFSTPANQLSASKQSVREELAFGLENLGVPRDEMDRRIDGVLDRLGIAHLADREPFALSGGEQQRVAIASIVAMGSRVLALDEPTAQLDPAGTDAVAALLAELAHGGTTILVAEHDPAVLGGTNRVAVLDGGRVAANDLPGRALGTAALAPLGLEPPTLVRLAEAAGLDPAAAFDEARIAAALAGGAATPRGVEVDAADDAGPPAWSAVSDRRPVGVEVEGLVHRYPGGVEAVRGVSLRIAPGETVAIVGQNGSGKTTLVKHLNGLLRPDAGRVLLDARDIAGEPVHQLAATVGFVFQSPDDQLFERSVEREVSFGPRTMAIEAGLAKRLIDGALAAAGLDDVRATNPYDLDLSRRKLVALASVLAIDPAVLVLDEPTTGQDDPGVRRVGAIVDAFAASGRTVVAITHDMEFAARHFDRIVVMRLGEVAFDGPPARAFAAHQGDLLSSTGLTAPPAARIAARLGLAEVPADAGGLLAVLRAGAAGPARRGRPIP